MYEAILVPDALDTAALAETAEAEALEKLLTKVNNRAIVTHDVAGATVFQFKSGRVIDINFVLLALSVGAKPVTVIPDFIDRSSGRPVKTVKTSAIKVWCSVPIANKDTNPTALEGDDTWADVANASGSMQLTEDKMHWLGLPIVGAPGYFDMQRESPLTPETVE